MLSWDHRPASDPLAELGEPVMEPIWLDPWPCDPAETAELREQIGLAYVAALQHLPPNQRAILILRQVLSFSAEEVASMLQTSTASVNSALQRARTSLPARASQDPLVPEEHRKLLDAFVAAWERADIDALVDMLSEDVRFTMPPLAVWFNGRDNVLGFIEHRVFATRWKLIPVEANGESAYACYQWDGSAYQLGAVNVLHVVHGRISWIAAFVDPAVTERFGLPKELAPDR